MPEVILSHDADPRFIYLSGPHGSPVPAVVRETIKAAPYYADFQPDHKRWRLPAGCREALGRELAAAGWHLAEGDPGRLPPRKHQPAPPCQVCSRDRLDPPPPGSRCGYPCPECGTYQHRGTTCECGANVPAADPEHVARLVTQLREQLHHAAPANRTASPAAVPGHGITTDGDNGAA